MSVLPFVVLIGLLGSWVPPRAALEDPARRDLNPQLDAAASTGYGGQRRAPARSSGTRRDQNQRQDETSSQRQDETRSEMTAPSRLFLLSGVGGRGNVSHLSAPLIRQGKSFVSP